MPPKYRTVVSVNKEKQEVIVTSRTKKVRLRKAKDIKYMKEGDICEIIGELAHPLTTTSTKAPKILEIIG